MPQEQRWAGHPAKGNTGPKYKVRTDKGEKLGAEPVADVRAEHGAKPFQKNEAWKKAKQKDKFKAKPKDKHEYRAKAAKGPNSATKLGKGPAGRHRVNPGSTICHWLLVGACRLDQVSAEVE